MVDYPLVWAEIDLTAIKHNIKILKNLIPENTKFMAVVKADAYGHGAVKVAQTAIQNGADMLGVARLHEAQELRNAGITAPILIFGFIFPDQAETVANLDLTATIYDPNIAKQLSIQACKKSITITAHLKIDTGMGRLGILSNPKNESISKIKEIINLPNLDIQGIYTHFASADSLDKSYSENQINVFTDILNQLKRQGIEFKTKHAANSAAIINFPQSHFDLVRAGLAMYGLYPNLAMKNSGKINLKPALKLKAIITSMKKVPRGFNISYGMTYRTKNETTIATVPIGYADGFSRLLSSKGCMLVNGKRAPIVGRICMDQTVIDIGLMSDAKIGDEVVIIGSQGKETITAEEVALKASTINYEIVSSLTARVPKFY